jgi:hypothetical protein
VEVVPGKTPEKNDAVVSECQFPVVVSARDAEPEFTPPVGVVVCALKSHCASVTTAEKPEEANKASKK